MDALIRSQLINLFDYDKYLAASLEAATNPAILNFAMILTKIYLIDDRWVAIINMRVVIVELIATHIWYVFLSVN